MRRMILTSIISLALTLAAGAVCAQTVPDGGNPQNTVSSTVSATGVIRAIDHHTRVVTLETAEGKEIMVDAPADFDLNKIKVGEQVNVEYTEALGFALQAPGTPMTGPTEQLTRERTAKGGVRTRVVTAVAEVIAVDAVHNQVTFRGPRGNVRTITVQDPAIQAKARQLKPGDKVQFTYAESAALSIKPAQPLQQVP